MPEIEHGVPIPSNAPPRRSKYGFAYMEIGDSLFVGNVGDRALLRLAAIAYRRRTEGWNFQIHPVDGGYRLWRIA